MDSWRDCWVYDTRDATNAGEVLQSRGDRLLILRTDGRTSSVPLVFAGLMSLDQIEQACHAPGPNDPTPDEIADRALAIRVSHFGRQALYV